MFMANEDMMLQPQVYDAGFETYNSILNVGGLYVMILLLIGGMLVSYVVALIIKFLFNAGCCKSVLMEGGEGTENNEENMEYPSWICIDVIQMRILQLAAKAIKLVNYLFINPILLVVHESIIQLLISGILFYYEPPALIAIQNLVNKFTVTMTQLFAGFCLAIFLTYTLICIFVLKASTQTLLKPQYLNRIGSLYQKFELEHGRNFLMVFIGRRVLIVVLALYYTDKIGIQIMTQMLVNLLIMIYVGQVRPFSNPRANRDQLLNEALIYMMTYILALFTDFCGSPDARYNLGWIYIVLNIIHIAIRFYGVIKGFIFVILRWLRKNKILLSKKPGNI